MTSILATLNKNHVQLTRKEDKNCFLRCMHDVSSQNVKLLPDVSMSSCMMYQQHNRPLYLPDNTVTTNLCGKSWFSVQMVLNNYPKQGLHQIQEKLCLWLAVGKTACFSCIFKSVYTFSLILSYFSVSSDIPISLLPKQKQYRTLNTLFLH